jgi:hypothetical protein
MPLVLVAVTFAPFVVMLGPASVLVLRLPVLRVPVLRLPVLRLPVLRLPVLRLPVLRLPVLRVVAVVDTFPVLRAVGR